jgi:glycerol dehydrogenase-like iron-containing ADH family enzyme
MPLGVLVDLDLVARSPRSLVASGVGDLLSNLSAVADWRLAHHGMPVDHHDLGLTDAEFVKAVLHAPDTRPDRFTVLEHLALSEVEVADAIAHFPDAVKEVLR